MKIKLHPLQSLIQALVLFTFVFTMGNATAQVGLTKEQVAKDVSEKLSEASGSMLQITYFNILESKEAEQGKFEVNIEMTVQADEPAIAAAIARANANKLSANWRQEAARIQRLAQSARKKNGVTETIQAVYQLSRVGAWEITEISDNTSEYTRLRNLNGPNSAPEEAQVVAEFQSMIKLLSNDAASFSSFEIFSATAMPNNQVKLNIRMQLKGDGNSPKNIDFARRVNGITNEIEAVYQRDAGGNWRRIIE